MQHRARLLLAPLWIPAADAHFLSEPPVTVIGIV